MTWLNERAVRLSLIRNKKQFPKLPNFPKEIWRTNIDQLQNVFLFFYETLQRSSLLAGSPLKASETSRERTHALASHFACCSCVTSRDCPKWRACLLIDRVNLAGEYLKWVSKYCYYHFPKYQSHLQDWESMLLNHSQRGESRGTAKHFIHYSDEFKT